MQLSRSGTLPGVRLRTTPSHRARSAKLGFFLSFLCSHDPTMTRRNHEASLLQGPRSSDERRRWRFTKASVPSFRVSCPKCLFGSPVSKHTKASWQTRQPGRPPSATYSSVRFIFFDSVPPSPHLGIISDKLSVFLTSKNSWFGRRCYGSCRCCVSDGGREDPVAGTDALPR